MSATCQSRGQIYAGDISIARTSATELNEVSIRRFKRAHASHDPTAGRPKGIGPIAYTAADPSQIFQTRPHLSVVQPGPLDVDERLQIRVIHRRSMSSDPGLRYQITAAAVVTAVHKMNLRRGQQYVLPGRRTQAVGPMGEIALAQHARRYVRRVGEAG